MSLIKELNVNQVALLRLFVTMPYEVLAETKESSFKRQYANISNILGSRSEADFVIKGKSYLKNYDSKHLTNSKV